MSSDGTGQRETVVNGATPSGRSVRRRILIVGAIVTVAVLVYGIVVALYAFSGRINGEGLQEDPEPPPGGVTVILTPESVDALNQRLVMNMEIEPSTELESEDGLALKRTVNVIVAPARGDVSTSFPAEAVPSTRPLDIIIDGSIESWPFDTYQARPLAVLAYTTDGDRRTPLQIKVHINGYIPGWSMSGRQMTDAEVGSNDLVAQNAGFVALDASRSGSTIAFGFVLLALMVVMPCLVLFVAISAFRAKRKVEPSFMSWMGAMLFATIPLRTFLPGSPPIGSWIDYLVVLWVVVGLITGLAIYVAAWWKWGARSDRARPSDPPPPPAAA